MPELTIAGLELKLTDEQLEEVREQIKALDERKSFAMKLVEREVKSMPPPPLPDPVYRYGCGFGGVQVTAWMSDNVYCGSYNLHDQDHYQDNRYKPVDAVDKCRNKTVNKFMKKRRAIIKRTW